MAAELKIDEHPARRSDPVTGKSVPMFDGCSGRPREVCVRKGGSIIAYVSIGTGNVNFILPPSELPISDRAEIAKWAREQLGLVQGKDSQPNDLIVESEDDD